MRRRFNVKRYFQVLGICVLALCLGFVGYMFVSDNHADSELEPEEIATVAAEELDGKINVLLLGLDESELRTDTIILASYDLENDSARLISIPRDTRMFIGTKYQKINAAHAIRASHGGAIGAQGTVEAVTRLTGIPINFYVSFPFDAVEECMDILGPVTYDVPDLGGDGVGLVYDDPVQDLHINLKPGVQELNGEQIVHLLRYRKGNLINGKRRTYKGGDVERIGVQQDFIKAFIDQKINAKLVADLPALFNQVSKSIRTNASFKDVVKYAPALADFDTSVEGAFQMWTLPGQSGTIDGVSYYLCNLEQTRGLVESEFGFDASEITDGKKQVSDAQTPNPKNKNSEKKNNSSVKPAETDEPKAVKTSKPSKSSSTEAPVKTDKPQSDREDDERDEEEQESTARPTARPTDVEPPAGVPAVRPTSVPGGNAPTLSPHKPYPQQQVPQATPKPPQATPKPQAPAVSKPATPGKTEVPVKGGDSGAEAVPMKPMDE